ncbi:IS3 family transposase [Streptomyces sennicomposti]
MLPPQPVGAAVARAERRADDDALVAEIRQRYDDHRGIYGVRRVHAELRGFGHTVNRKRIERLMRREGIEGRHLRRRQRTTIPRPARAARPGPGPTRLRRRPPEREVARRHHIRAGRRHVAVSGLRLGRLLASGARLVDGHGHAYRAVDLTEHPQRCGRVQGDSGREDDLMDVSAAGPALDSGVHGADDRSPRPPPWAAVRVGGTTAGKRRRWETGQGEHGASARDAATDPMRPDGDLSGWCQWW